MQTLDLPEAALFLKMNPEVLRRKAKLKIIPGNRAGRKWIFIKEHLADWVSGRYPEKGRELRVIDTNKEKKQKCQSTNVVKIKRGGSSSPQKTADAYNNLLQLK